MLHEQMEGCSSYSADEVERQEFLRTNDVLDHTAEYVQGVHIEQYVPEPTVQEQICHGLPPMEEVGFEGVESKQLSQYGRARQAFAKKGGRKYYDIDNDKVPCNSGRIAQKS